MARKSRKARDPSARIKKTFVLDEDLARRLASFAGRYGLHESAVVASALAAYLVGFKAFGGPMEKPEIRLADEGDEPARESA